MVKLIEMKNNIHDKVFTCPTCTNKTLYPVDGNEDILGIGWHDLCICDECGAEFYSEPQYNYTVKFVKNVSEAKMIKIQELFQNFYFGKEEYEKYGKMIQQKLSGKTVSKRAINDDGTPYEEENSLPNRAEEIGIDMWDLLEALEGMCYNGIAREIDDSTYKIL